MVAETEVLSAQIILIKHPKENIWKEHREFRQVRVEVAMFSSSKRIFITRKITEIKIIIGWVASVYRRECRFSSPSGVFGVIPHPILPRHSVSDTVIPELYIKVPVRLLFITKLYYWHLEFWCLSMSVLSLTAQWIDSSYNTKQKVLHFVLWLKYILDSNSGTWGDAEYLGNRQLMALGYFEWWYKKWYQSLQACVAGCPVEGLHSGMLSPILRGISRTHPRLMHARKYSAGSISLMEQHLLYALWRKNCLSMLTTKFQLQWCQKFIGH